MKLQDALTEDRVYTSVDGKVPHKHTYWIYSDEGGDGRTTSTSAGPHHAHVIKKCKVLDIGWEGDDKDPQEKSEPTAKLKHTHTIDCDPNKVSDANPGVEHPPYVGER